MRALWFTLLLLITVYAVTGQAPGDEDELCMTLPTREPFVNQEVLMSSLNYATILEDGPWIVLNEDNNNDGLTFTSQTTWTVSGTTCSETLAVCGFSFGGQNNWLITQFINNTLNRSDAYIRLRYSINTQCTTGCLTTLDVYVLHTNDTNQNIVRNTTVFGSQPTFSLTSTVRDGSPLIEALEVTVNSPTTGFYLAFRDLGTCVSLSEVTVFYPVCDKVSLDFGATFAERRFPGETSTGRCFTNMAINLNEPNNSFVATCKLESRSSMTQNEVFTNWAVSGGPSRCMCLPGYEFNGSSSLFQCQDCQSFTFKNTLSNDDVCQPCPMFSNGTDVAMAKCPCDPEYFRPMDGSEDALPCTRSPSVPRNVMVPEVTNTSVFLMWEAPEDNGGRTDLFYTVSGNVTNSVQTTNSTNITLTELIPFVYYALSVTADNGVSSQDNNVTSRTVTISIMTEEGVGGAVEMSSFRNNGNLLTWDVPVRPQGDITHYDVLVNGTDVFMTNGNQFNANSFGLSVGIYFVQVRAVTEVGPGNYSEPYKFTVVSSPDTKDDSTNLGPIVGAVVGAVILILIIVGVIIIIVLCIIKQRTGKHNVNDITMSYAVQNDENIVKKLPGIRKYVDPQNYSSPDAALKDFAHEIPSHQLRLDEVIGGGEFGDVCRGIWYKPSSKHLSVAIKTLKPGSPYKDRVDFLTEASIMGQFHHPNVITLYGVVTKSQPVMIVMEYMENKSLDVYLRKNDDLLGPKRLVTMAKGVAAGMQYFGDIGFVHRDLAARNVLVSKDEVCKIADFGLSRETVDNAYDVKTGGKIPIRWTAPEAIQYRKFTAASDVWSFGVLLWEVMSYGQQPYWDWSNHKVLDEVEAGYRLEIPKDCPQSVYQTMLDCWNLDHRLRPKFDEIGKELEELLQNNFKSARSNNNNHTIQNSVCPLDYDSIERWLQAIKMDRYIDTFKQNNLLQPKDCLGLTHTTLMDMGITLSGHQHKILSSIQTATSRLQREPSYKI